MGYCINQEEAEFTIPKENFSRCLEAIKGLMNNTDKMTGGAWTGGQQVARWFAWVNTEEVLSAENLADALDAWRWEAEVGPNGDIIDILFRGEKSGSDDVLFTAIAPFVKCGSYIQMRGEENEVWRWIFSGGKLQEKYAKLVWE